MHYNHMFMMYKKVHSQKINTNTEKINFLQQNR